MSNIKTAPRKFRGKFRHMEMEQLQAATKLKLWDNEETVEEYALPIEALLLKEGPGLTKGIARELLTTIGPITLRTNNLSHIGPFRHALDFMVVDGTGVYATRDGKVIEVVEKFDEYGSGPEYRDKLNYLTIAHSNGEFSQYCHLEKLSVKKMGIKVSSFVQRGRQIGIVGKTGWTTGDHLHFIVFRNDPNPANPFGFKSLRVKFQK